MIKTFLDLLDSGEISAPQVRADEYFLENAIPPEVPKMGKRVRAAKSPIKTMSDRSKRRKMKIKLISWGASGELTSPFEAIADLEGYGQTYGSDGYDSGLSDYMSEMITINMEVEKLNQVDYDLICWTFRDGIEDPQTKWVNKYGRSTHRFNDRRGELLLYLYNKIR